MTIFVHVPRPWGSKRSPRMRSSLGRSRTKGCCRELRDVMASWQGRCHLRLQGSCGDGSFPPNKSWKRWQSEPKASSVGRVSTMGVGDKPRHLSWRIVCYVCVVMWCPFTRSPGVRGPLREDRVGIFHSENTGNMGPKTPATRGHKADNTEKAFHLPVLVLRCGLVNTDTGKRWGARQSRLPMALSPENNDARRRQLGQRLIRDVLTGAGVTHSRRVSAS